MLGTQRLWISSRFTAVLESHRIKIIYPVAVQTPKDNGLGGYRGLMAGKCLDTGAVKGSTVHRASCTAPSLKTLPYLYLASVLNTCQYIYKYFWSVRITLEMSAGLYCQGCERTITVYSGLYGLSYNIWYLLYGIEWREQGNVGGGAEMITNWTTL